MIQVSVENTGQLARRIKVVVPPEQVENEIKNRLQKLTKTVRIEGFRPGKAPLNVISQRYGDSVRSEVAEWMLQTSLNKALTQENLMPATMPVVESIKMEKDQPFEFVATFELFPDVQIKDLNDLKLEKENVTISDADLDTVLQQIRKQNVGWKIVDRAAAKGDKVVLDLNWMSDEKPPQAREQKNIPWILEPGAIPIEWQLLENVKVGDEVKIQIPLNTPDKKSIDATAKIIEVAEPELPELNDAFAKQMDVENLNALKDQVRDHMMHQVDEAIKNKLKSRLLEVLVTRHDFDLPNGLIQEEVKNLEENIRSKYAKGTSPEVINQAIKTEHEKLQQAAKRRVKLGMLFNALVKKYDLKVDVARVQERIRYFSGMFQDPAYGLQMVSNDKNLLATIRSQVLEDQIVDKLLEQTQYTQKTVAYADFLKQEEHAHAGEAGHHHPADRPVTTK